MGWKVLKGNCKNWQEGQELYLDRQSEAEWSRSWWR